MSFFKVNTNFPKLKSTYCSRRVDTGLFLLLYKRLNTTTDYFEEDMLYRDGRSKESSNNNLNDQIDDLLEGAANTNRIRRKVKILTIDMGHS